MERGERMDSRLQFLFNILILVPSCWASNDTLSQSQPLLLGQTLVSSGKIFELGFFTPGNSSKLYVGIWHKLIPAPARRIVWVANRGNAISGSDSGSSLIIGNDGNLKLTDGRQQTAWSTNVSVSSNSTIAVLTDEGNFLLKDNASGLVLWESFSFLADTFLFNMLLGFNSKTGEKRFLTNWKSENDPATGTFLIGLSEEKPPQIFTWNDSKPYWRGGPWNGWRFNNIIVMSAGYAIGMVLTQNDQRGTVYLSSSVVNNSYLAFLRIAPSGSLQRLNWDGGRGQWKIVWESISGPCDVYGACGPFGFCSTKGTNSICECLKGFHPKSDEEWGKGNWTSGCSRKTMLNCGINISNFSSNKSGNDGFLKLSGMNLPDHFEYFQGKDAQSCRQWCLDNCSCLAYAYPLGLGCMVWVKDLIDIRKFPFSGEDLYLRLAKSDLGVEKTLAKLLILLLVISGIILLGLGGFLYYLHKRKVRRSEYFSAVARANTNLIKSPKKSGRRRSRSGNKIKDFLWAVKCGVSSDTQQDQDVLEGPASSCHATELPLMEFRIIKRATNNFSEANKLGVGGFGTVYKGRLEDGQPIAVKRLSSHSAHCIEEFKNEVLLISKLQHRNLVRLLGCCIQGGEKLLILEFMRNRSLDTFLFDPTKRKQLNWVKRFNIIEGIARGLLYLHRDSCLRIIHRDLKASNILLDDDMNPKITDFGLARGFRITQDLAQTQRVMGTFGYMSPEYAMGGIFSEKLDVYSFGVLLLEIISSKKNTEFHDHEKYYSLLGYAWQLWDEGKGMEFMDESMADSYFPSEVMRCIQIGLLCVQDHPAERPSMSHVVKMLSSEMDLPQPRQPIFTFSTSADSDLPPWACRACTINEVSLSEVEGR